MRRLIMIFTLLVSAFSCEFRTVRLISFAVQGIDVSHYQSYIDWEVVSRQNIHFTFVKATEGAFLTDTLFCRNWSEIEKTGIKKGAYHFFRPDIPVEFQIENFITSVEMKEGDLPPVLDVEVLDDVDPKDLVKSMKQWLHAIETNYHIQPIIYTNLNFYHAFLADDFADYPVWIARYSYEHPLLSDDKQWYFWQYGNRGMLDGIEGYVDFNVFHGSFQELEALCLQPAALLSMD